MYDIECSGVGVEMVLVRNEITKVSLPLVFGKVQQSSLWANENRSSLLHIYVDAFTDIMPF
jgi:hypothetical protein